MPFPIKDILQRGDSFSVLGVYYTLDVSKTLIHFYLMPYTPRNNGKTTFRFPGGRKAGVEDCFLALKREWKQEVSATHAEDFSIHFGPEPILVLPESDQHDHLAVHYKVAFRVDEVHGSIRDTLKVEQGRGTSLGVLSPYTADEAVRILFRQGPVTRFHALSSVFALRDIVGKSNTRFEEYYGPTIARYSDLMADTERLMRETPRDIAGFKAILDKHKQLFGAKPTNPQ